jgi:phosphoribosyl 1,2-cyclic phosphate phosphodiesterase
VEGAETLVVNALRFAPDHHAHQNVDDAIRFARKVGARRTWLVHSCHDIGLHEEVNRQLPADIQLAYDGQVVEIA